MWGFIVPLLESTGMPTPLLHCLTQSVHAPREWACAKKIPQGTVLSLFIGGIIPSKLPGSAYDFSVPYTPSPSPDSLCSTG